MLEPFAIENYVNLHLLFAAALGALIGLERELSGKDPSLRTFSLISLGSCIFAMISLETFNVYKIGDPSRIAAQIIPGIGFIGAGTIFRSKRGVSGFTTAALMWVTAGIGMSVGLNRIDLAVSSTIIAIFMTLGLRLMHMILYKINPDRDREHDPGDDSAGG